MNNKTKKRGVKTFNNQFDVFESLNLNLHNKKSQLTLFMIIGFLGLILTSIVIYTIRSSEENKSHRGTSSTQETSLDISSITNYVSSCLEKVTRDAINLLGNQGGVIYKDQGGIKIGINLSIGADYVNLLENGIETNVTYGIKRINNSGFKCNDDFDCNRRINTLNEQVVVGNFIGNPYPWVDFNDSSNRYCNYSSWGCFGKNMLPKLGMYKQIKTYINNTIEGCTDFSVFAEEGYQITPMDNAKTNVNITNQTLFVVLDYPIKIIDPVTKKQTTLDTFYYETEIRLLKVLEIAHEIINSDIIDERYKITDYQADPFINISIIKANGNNIIIQPNENYIVNIRDNFSKRPFNFRFAVQNRAPALVKYDGTISKMPSSFLTDEELEDLAQVFDPDDDKTTKYYYSPYGLLNWTEDFSIKLNPSIFCKEPYNDHVYVYVCTSDNYYPSGPCVWGYDKSMDWQVYDIEMQNCPP